MKIAIVHDWLTGMRGGEKCLEIFCELFPQATVFTLLHNKGSVSSAIENMDIRTSFIQNMPAAATSYRSYLPFFPRAIESFDLSGFDLILSSSHCVAKGIKVPTGATHICYCYSPMRYAWVFFDEYFGNLNPIKRSIISFFIKRLKRWDLRANESVDFFIAISDNIKSRIYNYYKREADVIYPPVDTEKLSIINRDEGYYLIVSALVPYKRIDLAIEAFNRIGKKLIVIGNGDSEAALKSSAKPNIKFLGWVDNEAIADYYSRCSAVIFPGEEDFGIVPVEAQACGKPVIAYARGGVLETVVPINKQSTVDNRQSTDFQWTVDRGLWTAKDPTGVFFYEQTPQALAEAVEYFESVRDKFNPQALRANALRFSRDIFKRNVKEYIDKRLK